MSGQRFASLSNDDMKRILAEKDSQNTVKVNKNSSRIFEAYLREQNWIFRTEDGVVTSWVYAAPDELAKALTSFYAGARTQNSEHYKKTTMLTIRNGLNRYVNAQRKEAGLHNIDLTRDAAFNECNEMFKAMGKVLKREGKANVEHYPAIATEDLKRMKTYSREDIDNPKVLQQAVFVNISIYFGRRGRENIRQLKITDFAVTTDAAGDLYLYKVSDERTKNHQEDGGKKEARMYQVKGEQMIEKKYVNSCPLRALGNGWIGRTYGLYYTDCIPYISGVFFY